MNHFDYRNGVLHAEAVNLIDLADAVGTPFYCYSTATLERHYRVFCDAFAGEKERKTLESLLHLPVRDRDLYIAKLLVGFLPSVAVASCIAPSLGSGGPYRGWTRQGSGRTRAQNATRL